jgi:pimeloyl-ACP methyl ester carboxylesterase
MKTPSSDEGTESINGMRMYYEIRGAGEPLVLLHGGTGIGADWALIFNDPPKDYRLVVPDLRGHGRSTNPSLKFTFRQSALDVFALLDRLEVGRFKAIGMSMGAKTLLHMATQQPSRVEAMVLVSAAHYFPDQARAVMRQMTPEGHTDEEWEFMRRRHKHGDEQIRALWRMSLEMHTAIPGSYLWVIPNGGHGPIFGERAGSGVTTSHFAETALAFLRGDWQGA